MKPSVEAQPQLLDIYERHHDSILLIMFKSKTNWLVAILSLNPPKEKQKKENEHQDKKI